MNSIKKMLVVSFASTLLCSAGLVNANEVVVAQSMNKRAVNSVSLDILSNGDASAFQFSIPVDSKSRSVSKSLDLSRCLADLPKAYTGQCTYRAKSNDVLVVVYSVEGVPLPKGMVGLGVISGAGLSAKSATPTEVIFASPLGKEL